MTCECCETAKVSPLYRMYDPACLECGARYLRSVKRLAIPQDKKVAWLRQVLSVWMEQGHSEQRLRELSATTGRAGS